MFGKLVEMLGSARKTFIVFKWEYQGVLFPERNSPLLIILAKVQCAICFNYFASPESVISIQHVQTYFQG